MRGHDRSATELLRSSTVHVSPSRQLFRSTRRLFVGRVYFVGRRADFFVRAEHEIIGRDHFFDGSLDLFGRRVIFFGRRGESFRRRDPHFRRRADYFHRRVDFFVPRVYFFDARAMVFFPRDASPDGRDRIVPRSAKAFGDGGSKNTSTRRVNRLAGTTKSRTITKIHEVLLFCPRTKDLRVLSLSSCLRGSESRARYGDSRRTSSSATTPTSRCGSARCRTGTSARPRRTRSAVSID